MLPPTVPRAASFKQRAAAVAPAIVAPAPAPARAPSRRSSLVAPDALPSTSAGPSRRASDSRSPSDAPPLTAPLGLPGDVVLPQALAPSAAPLIAPPASEDEPAAILYDPRPFSEAYELGEVLGQGSYGTVRAATHRGTGQQVAVKILPRRRGREDRTDTIENEVRMWAAVAPSCRDVAALHAVHRDAHSVYLVQELCSGGDLQGLVDALGTLSEPEAAAAMRCVLSALAACHAQGVCFGDVKPANFLLPSMWPGVAHLLDPAAPRGALSLRAADFGCAQRCPDGCQVSAGLSGTPVYMAPEVVGSRSYHLPIDIWAAGVMLYQLLTGRFPFWDADMDALNAIHPRRILEDVRAGRVLMDVPAAAALSQGARDLMAAMLQHDPDQRITAADALAHPWISGGGRGGGAPQAAHQ